MKLKQLVKNTNKSRRQIAEELEIGYMTLNNWIYNYSMPTSDNYNKLLAYFKVHTIDDITPRELGRPIINHT